MGIIGKFNGRKRNTRDEIDLYIFTNGETEKIYFEDLIQDLGLKRENFRIELVSLNCTDPLEFVKKIAQRVKNDRITVPIWLVFDYDDRKDGQFDNAIYKARASKFEVAYSNECFEVWFFLHSEFFNSPKGRNPFYWDKMTDILKKKDVKIGNRLFSNYKKNGKNLHLYQYFKDETNTAVANAKKLEKFWDDEDEKTPSKRKPSTHVYKLVEDLLGKKQ
jgi:hypothetical protein